MYVQRFVVWRHGLLSVFSKLDILGIGYDSTMRDMTRSLLMC